MERGEGNKEGEVEKNIGCGLIRQKLFFFKGCKNKKIKAKLYKALTGKKIKNKTKHAFFPSPRSKMIFPSFFFLVLARKRKMKDLNTLGNKRDMLLFKTFKLT